MATDQKKVTVTLPKHLLKRLDELVPNRKRSSFIGEAIEEHLNLVEQAVALEEAAGLWSEAHHPELSSDEAIDAWLKDLRQGW